MSDSTPEDLQLERSTHGEGLAAYQTRSVRPDAFLRTRASGERRADGPRWSAGR
jgi:hypothetical protein